MWSAGPESASLLDTSFQRRPSGLSGTMVQLSFARLRPHALLASAFTVLAAQSHGMAPTFTRGSGARSALVKAYSSIPQGGGRFVGGFFPPSSRVSVPGAGTEGVRIEALRKVENGGSEVALGDSALAGLLTGHLEQTLAQLAEATKREPSNADLWSDLAAARLAAFEAWGRAEDLVFALAAADEAVRRQIHHPEALFNLALALQKLSLLHSAEIAWSGYLEVDPRSPWASRAEQALRHLKSIPPAFSWRQAVGKDPESFWLEADLPKLMWIVASDRQGVRLWSERELLPLWAKAFRAHQESEAARHFEVLRKVGEVEKALAGDGMVGAVVAQIDQLLGASDVDKLRAIAEGITAFAEGVRALSLRDAKAARPYFLTSYARLEEVENPFAAWASLESVNCDLIADSYSTAREALDRCAACDQRNLFPALAARADWFRGLAAMKLALWSESLTAFERSARAFEKLGETENLAALDQMIAENYKNQGNEREAWSRRHEGLRLRPTVDPSIRIHNALLDASVHSLARGEPRIAFYFETEMVDYASRLQNGEAPIIEALLQRAATLHQLGEEALAEADLSNVAARLKQVESAEDRRALAAELAALQGEMAIGAAPHAAIDALSQAILSMEERNTPFRLATLYRLRASAQAHLGRADRAEEDLILAANRIEEERVKVGPLDLRRSYFDQRRDLFDQLIAIKLGRHDVVGAFECNEDSRSLASLDRLRSASVPPAPVCGLASSTREVAAGRIAGWGVLEFRAVGEDLYAWVLRDGAIFCWRVEEKKRTLVALAADVRRRMEESKGEDPGSGLSRLYDLLIVPAAPTLSGCKGLLVIPDGPLGTIPFPALFDRRSREFLIERYPIVVSPSLRLSLQLFGRQRSGAPRSALAVAVSEARDARGRWLPRLEVAEHEASAVVRTYPEGLVLIDETATRGRVLESIPRFEVLHIAAHQLIGSAEEGPQIALAPARASGSLSRSFLTITDFDSFSELPTQLAVLASCGSIQGVPSESEGPGSFGLALLRAGVPQVVASLWNVSDRAAEPLLLALHRSRSAGKGGAAALQEAQREALLAATQRGDPRWAWSSFVILGAPDLDSRASSDRRSPRGRTRLVPAPM